LKAFILSLSLLTVFSANAALFGDFVLESTVQSYSLQTKQNGNILSFQCDIKNPEIQTVLDTQSFYAYNDDPSILIFELNGFRKQLSGDGSDSMFSSCFDCDNELLYTILKEINSSIDGVLNLEAISLSSGMSSRASFNIHQLDEAMVELQKNCQQLSIETANLLL
jgi:hypothetical protein